MTNGKARLDKIEDRISPRHEDLEIQITRVIVDRGPDGEPIEVSRETRPVRIIPGRRT